jgi:chromosome segregation ATPase
MRLKSVLPWLCILGLIAGLAWMYGAAQKKDTELAALREESQELQKLRAAAEDAKNASDQSESDELARLRKDHEELLRLRNEVSQLRGDKQRLANQLQTAQAQAQGAQAQVQALRSNPAQPGNAAQQNPALAAALAARGAQPAANTEQAQATICINNLRTIDGAKQQWALEKQKPSGALLTAADISPYLKSNTVPVCPAGGVYTLNPVGVAPICNIPGHSISR